MVNSGTRRQRNWIVLETSKFFRYVSCIRCIGGVGGGDVRSIAAVNMEAIDPDASRVVVGGDFQFIDDMECPRIGMFHGGMWYAFCFVFSFPCSPWSLRSRSSATANTCCCMWFSLSLSDNSVCLFVSL